MPDKLRNKINQHIEPLIFVLSFARIFDYPRHAVQCYQRLSYFSWFYYRALSITRKL